ncbi:MAG: nitroreductase family protein [Clostridia bacterium]
MEQWKAYDLILRRRSVRTYDGRPLCMDHKKRMEAFIREDNHCPFHAGFMLVLEDTTEQPVSTYGVIKGAETYLAGKTENSEKGLLAYGYVFEKILLYALGLGISSCWLAGTYKKGRFAKVLSPGDGEVIPAVSPMGYEKEEKRMVDTLFKSLAGSGGRKSWNEIFFQDQFTLPLPQEKVPEYKDPLEAVRLAPSASNKQPWSVVYGREAFHFYKNEADSYGKSLGMDIQMVDMGIATCHFDLVMREQGHCGNWQFLALPKEGHHRYVVSYVL